MIWTWSLKFWWIIAVHHEGATRNLPGKWVTVMWKPLVWFVKGSRADTNLVQDVVRSKREKIAHDWQQSIHPPSYLIERLCPRGGLVLDPFLGSGTTGVASVRLGRRFCGSEIDQEAFHIARARIGQELNGEMENGKRLVP